MSPYRRNILVGVIGLGEVSNIAYRGVIVGRVLTVKRSPDGDNVEITAEIDKLPPLPANVEGGIRQISQLGGTSNIQLVIVGPKAVGTLQDKAQLKAHYEGLTLFPPEFSDLANE